MADEINVIFSLKTSLTGESPIIITPGVKKYTKTGKGKWSDTVNVTTGEITISSFGGLTTEGWCVLENLDTTNYIRMGSATAAYNQRIEAGEIHFMRLEPGTTLYLAANTSACELSITVLED